MWPGHDRRILDDAAYAEPELVARVDQLEQGLTNLDGEFRAVRADAQAAHHLSAASDRDSAERTSARCAGSSVSDPGEFGDFRPATREV